MRHIIKYYNGGNYKIFKIFREKTLFIFIIYDSIKYCCYIAIFLIYPFGRKLMPRLLPYFISCNNTFRYANITQKKLFFDVLFNMVINTTIGCFRYYN